MRKTLRFLYCAVTIILFISLLIACVPSGTKISSTAPKPTARLNALPPSEPSQPTDVGAIKPVPEMNKLIFPKDKSYWLLVTGIFSDDAGYNNSDGSHNADIGVVRPDGSHFTQLTNTTNEDKRLPAWSPDGSKIAYIHWDDAPNGKRVVVVMNSDGTQRKEIGEYDFVKWSPDGKKLAGLIYGYGRHWKIDVFSPDGSAAKTVAEGDSALAVGYTDSLFDDGLSWSPDGSKIAYLLLPSAGKAYNEQENEIHIADIASGTDQLLVTTMAGEFVRTVSWMKPSGIFCANLFGGGRSDTGGVLGRVVILKPNGDSTEVIKDAHYATCDKGEDRITLVDSSLKAYVYDLANGKTQKIPDFPVFDSTFTISTDGNYVAYIGAFDDGKVTVVNLQTGEETHPLSNLSGKLGELEFSPFPMVPGQ